VQPSVTWFRSPTQFTPEMHLNACAFCNVPVGGDEGFCHYRAKGGFLFCPFFFFGTPRSVVLGLSRASHSEFAPTSFSRVGARGLLWCEVVCRLRNVPQ